MVTVSVPRVEVSAVPFGSKDTVLVPAVHVPVLVPNSIVLGRNSSLPSMFELFSSLIVNL